MANIIIAFPNLADEATLSGGTWSTGLPLANLQNRLLSRVARTANALAASTQFDTALVKDRPVRVLVLVGHNLSLAATYRIRGATTADFAAPVYDSGWLEAWPAVYDTLSLEWEDDRWWDGRLTGEDLAGYIRNLICVLPVAAIARYWRIEMSDTTNAAGYIEIGRLFVSGQWQPVINMSYGMGLGYESNSLVEESIGGTEYFDKRKNNRVLKFGLDWLNHEDAHSRALEIQRQADIHGEIFVIPDADDSAHLLRRSFLGRLKTLSPIENPYYSTYKTAFEIKEII